MESPAEFHWVGPSAKMSSTGPPHGKLVMVRAAHGPKEVALVLQPW